MVCAAPRSARRAVITVIESRHALAIRSRMPAGQRLLLLAMAAIPLLAPYELLLRPQWQDRFGWAFLFAAAISAGALLVSALLAWCGLAGLDHALEVDRSRGALVYRTGATVVRRRTVRYPLAALASLQVEAREWSEGAPSYVLSAILDDGRALRLGSSFSRQELDTIARRVDAFLGR